MLPRPRSLPPEGNHTTHLRRLEVHRLPTIGLRPCRVRRDGARPRRVHILAERPGSLVGGHRCLSRLPAPFLPPRVAPAPALLAAATRRCPPTAAPAPALLAAATRRCPPTPAPVPVCAAAAALARRHLGPVCRRVWQEKQGGWSGGAIT
eukprot:10195044-Lingulodinium_polyedra.AAC.2